jgi:two-component system nitrate/nitrite response regulator NarL
MSEPIRILLVDDHRHAREGMRTIVSAVPDFVVVGEASSGEEALVLTEKLVPDVILMDINMPGMSGLEAVKVIKSAQPSVKIIMVTVSDDVSHLFEALKKGAQGYLLKNLNPSSWRDYLRAVAVDEAPLNPELAMSILREFADRKNNGTP